MPLSPSESAKKLDERYSLMIQDDHLTETLEMVKSYVDSQPQLSEKNKAAKRFIVRLFSRDCKVFTDRTSGIDTCRLLALVFLAIHDADKRVGNLEQAKAKFVDGLYKIQREYNFSREGEDRAGEDKPCGPEGTFNKLVEILEGIHPDCCYIDIPNNQNLLKDLPRDVLMTHMLPYLTNPTLKSLSETGRFFYYELTPFERLMRPAASGEQKDIDVVLAMIKANPRLLLQRGDVVTRGGTKIINTTVYEFFLGSGHTEALLAMREADLFALLPDGEDKRMHQYDRYRPHIEQLREDVQAFQDRHEVRAPAYDSSLLIDLIIESSPADVTAELNQTKGHESKLRKAMCDFREVINKSQRERTEGMHYAHYTTIMQVLHLLDKKWRELSHNNTNYDKCKVVFSQIFGYLQLVGLSFMDRCAFARDFSDKKLSVECIYNPGCRLQDFNFSNLPCTGLGFTFGIIARWPWWRGRRAVSDGSLADFKLSVEQKLDALGTYAHTAADRDTSVERPASLR